MRAACPVPLTPRRALVIGLMIALTCAAVAALP